MAYWGEEDGDEGSNQMYKMLSNEALSSGAYNDGFCKGTS